MGRGYSGNHPRFSHRQDERYDAKEAYNKDLSSKARLHYLENDRHDHESPAHSHCSPMHRHNDKHIMREAKQIARTGTICNSDGVEGLVTSGNISPLLGHPIGIV